MWKQVIYEIFTYGIFIYSVVILSSYIFIAIYSIGETRKYFRKRSFTDYTLLASSSYAPSVSILAPAYNEASNIIENVRSLLSIHYNHLEVIVINDGSKDDSMQRLIESYDLELVNFLYHEQIPAKRIKGIYKSRNIVYKKLVVVDKENGGKADALNTGINLASNQYLVCIDVDCVLEQDALLKLIMPFIEETGKRVIATGGVVRVANSCIIQNGRLVDVNLPKEFLPRVQTLEYIRAFLLGRMAWSRLNGLLLISGAFGAFDREIVIKAGGYNHKTVGEDMELVVRMRRYMEEHDIPYKVSYIPDPLCWTEVPATYKILGRQRNRWTRGTIETLRIHRILFFNPRYGLLGMLSYPYWFFFEFLAPIIEFIGILGFIFFAITGIINWAFFFALLGFILTFGWLYSIFAILMEVLTFNQYKKNGEVTKLVLTAILEPFFFHPFVVWSAIRGNIDLLRKKNSWGEMTRQGFHGQTGINEKFIFLSKLRNGFYAYLPIATGWLLFLVLLSATDFFYNGITHQYPKDPVSIFGIAFLNDQVLFLKLNFCMAFLYVGIYLLSKRMANIIIISLTIVFTLGSMALMQYFRLSFVPLGADLYDYSIKEIKQTIGSSGGVNIWLALIVGIIVAALLAIYKWVSPLLRRSARWLNLATFIIAITWLITTSFSGNTFTVSDEYASNVAKNKLNYFFSSSFEHFFPKSVKAYDNTGATSSVFHYIDEAKYPFLHSDSGSDVLTPFLNSTAKPPNIVMVIVEGLGRAFTNNNAYLGSFTPYLDSLSKHSLYWENFLSNGGRTFAVLPSILGSLPFGEAGFNDLAEKIPHLSLMSILKTNGYHTSFYYGGDAGFDNMALFLRKQQIDSIFDITTFPADFPKLPENNGFSWGYGDKELFRHVMNKEDEMPNKQPYLKVVLTVATHSPFLINEQDHYLKQFEAQMTILGLSEKDKEEHRKYDHQFASVLYLDDAIRSFINNYRTKPDFENTIFIITGDHRMPEIPMSTKIDRYHVPLIIYSSLLKRTASFESISSHSDITPSILAFLKEHYQLRIPSSVSWVGSGIDTARSFRNIHSTALKQTKSNLVDFIMGDYHLNENNLFKMTKNMDEEPDADQEVKARLQAAFAIYKQKNALMLSGGALLPDSIYKAYYPR